MTIGFFFFFFLEGWGAVFWREKEETDEMTEKNEPFEVQHQKEHRLDKMPVSPKTLKSAPPPHTHTQTLVSPVLN